MAPRPRNKISCASASFAAMSAIWGPSRSAWFIIPGSWRRSAKCWASVSGDMWPRCTPADSAINANTVNWQVNALVEATPTSTPANVGTTKSLSRAIVLVATLTTDKTCPTWPLAWRNAASVSAVSPDWLTKSAILSGPKTGSR